MELVSVSEDNLFVEREEAKCLVTVLTNTKSTVDDKNSALERLRKIFDNYLECPTLLRHDVRSFVSSLLQVARQTLASPEEEIDLDQCAHALSAIYALSKVRGRKDIQRLLSHEVEDVEPVLRALRQSAFQSSAFHSDSKKTASSSSEVVEPQRWESLYLLWNWMETLSLVPFNCTALFVDSSSVIDSLVDLGMLHLSQTGPTREAAASALAAWLSRPDLESTEIPRFVSWGRHVMLEQSIRSSLDVFLLLGVIQTLVRIIKVSSSSREKVLGYMAPLWEVFLRLEDYNVCDNNLLLRKFMVKWWSRMGCIYLPPCVTSWRYQRGRRSLADNLTRGLDGNHPKGSNEATQRSSTAASLCHQVGAGKSLHAPQQHYQALWHVPDEVEVAMGFLLDKLQDSSTMVRWAAAKGVGRLTERLPAVCADDVLDALLAMFADREADRAWHGSCLALAELARRGLLLPHRLSQLVPMVVLAIQVS
jgi:tubulin-specific chaperone D